MEVLRREEVRKRIERIQYQIEEIEERIEGLKAEMDYADTHESARTYLAAKTRVNVANRELKRLKKEEEKLKRML